MYGCKPFRDGKGERGMLRTGKTVCISLIAVFMLAAVSNVPAQTLKGEDGSPIPIEVMTSTFIDGTRVDKGLASQLNSTDLVPVIIILRNQPGLSIAREVQSMYMPQVREKNLAVRGILSKYAGKRDFSSMHELQQQARLEASAVTVEDRNLIKSLNGEADTLLSVMRKEIISRTTSAVAGEQAQVESLVSMLGGKVTYSYIAMNSIAASVPGNMLVELSKHPLVESVFQDKLLEMHLDNSAPSVFAGTFWNAGWNGAIYDAGIVDSGIDTSHPSLDDDTFNGRAWYSRTFHATASTQSSYYDDASSTDDFQGHGTHVAGIVFSSSSVYRGIAFGGDVGVNIKAGYRATDYKAYAYASDVFAGLDWAQQIVEEPEAINLSYGGEVDVDDDNFARFIDAYAEAKLCVMGVSAGNSGPNGSTVCSPGISYNNICVANMNDQNTTNRSDDVISNSSSRGPTVSVRKKPDITAPGSGILSTNNTWEGTGDDFVSKSGTSMAAPHVTAAAVLLNDAGVLHPLEVKALLINTADDWGDPDWDPVYGWGYLNLDRAYLHRDDVFLGSVTPNGTPGSNKLYKTTGMDAGETATLTWYRHVEYNSSGPTTWFLLNDLNMRLYDESTDQIIDYDLSGVNNVHQVTSNRSGPQVIRVYAYSSSFSNGGSTETYALATQEGTILAADPTVTPVASNYTPPLYAKFPVSVRVDNNGDVAAHLCRVTLTLPAGVTLAEGSLTQDLGSIPAGSSKYAYYLLDTTSAGVKTVHITTSSYSYGLDFSGTGSFTITPAAQDTVKPYSTLQVHGNNYQYISSGTNVVLNGGFETDLSKWTTSGTVTIQLGDCHSGEKSLKLGPGAGSAYQTITIGESAFHAILTFWYKSTASSRVSAGCMIQDTSGNILVYPFTSTSNQSKWTKAIVDVSRFCGQTIRLHFYSLSNPLFGSSTLYVDDITLKENELVWVDDTTSMTISARDDNSGLDYTQYHINNDPWTTYTSSFNLAGKPDGAPYIYYRSVDNTGNVEPTITASFLLDTTAPKSTLKIDSPRSIVGGIDRAANGKFESGTTGWMTIGAVSVVNSPVHGGSKAMKIGGTEKGTIYQDIPISATATNAVITAWVRSVEGSGTTGINVTIKDSSTGMTCYSIGYNYTSNWTMYAWDVSGFRGSSVRIQFDVVHSSGEAATLYVDDVSLSENCNTYIAPSTTLRICPAEYCGVKKYEHNIDSTGYVTGQIFTIPTAGLHTLAYRALDNLNHQESDVNTRVTVDDTGPTGSIIINNGAAYTTSTLLTLQFTASDVSGVTMMRIRSDTGVWGAWQSYQPSMTYALYSATDGIKTISVEFMDTLGNEGQLFSDSIEYRVPVIMDIPDVKHLANGKGVRLERKVVTAIFPLSNCFYISEPDRTGGICVSSDTLPSKTGIYVNVEGITETYYAERRIIATKVNEGPVTDEIKPIAMTNNSLGCGQFGLQSGVPGTSGLNNVGLLVTTTGRVMKHYANSFYICDGGSVVDSWSNEPWVLVDKQSLGGWLPPVGSYVSVTGISGMSTLSGSPIRILRPRSVDDVLIRQIDAAYMYSTNLTNAQSFESLLDPVNIKTDLIHIDNATGVDLGKYDVILIGSDTETWNNPASLDAILAANTPVIGLGTGGAKFLDKVPDLFIGWMNSASVTEIRGIIAGGDFYNYPYNLGVDIGDRIDLYFLAAYAWALYDQDAYSNHILRAVDLQNYYPLASEGGRFYQWGYFGSPTYMTDTGKKFFINLVFGTLKP